MYGHERIKTFLYNEPRMKPFLDKAEKECQGNNCQSYVAIINTAIEKLLDAYEDKCDDLKFLEKHIK